MEILRTMQAELQATPPEMKAELIAKWDAATYRVMAKWDSRLPKVKACEGTTKICREATEAYEERTEACLEEEKEPGPEEPEAMEKSWEFPEGAADEEKFRAAKDRAGELRLAVRRHRQQKKRAQEKGEPRQKFAAFRGRFTHHAVPALLKGHVHKGPRKNRRSGVRGPGKTFRTRIDGQSLKQRQTHVNMACETPEGRTDEKGRQTHPECNSGIQRLSKTSGNGKRGRTEKWCLEGMEADREIIRRSLRLEIAKLMIMSFIGLREPGDGTLWKCRPPPKRKR
jgi:hypothetical protein